ncbi:MAG: hypothetical protein WC599_12020, partial [Bacteroidales bacterium]
MRLNLALILSIIIAVGLVAFGFTFYQISSERTKLNSELEIRTTQIAEEIFQNDTFSFKQINKENIRHFADSINKKYNLLGIAIYYNNDSIISDSASCPLINHSLDYISQSITADTSLGNFITVEGKNIYQYIKPLKREDISNNAVIFYTDAEYIDNIIGSIWFRNFFRWFLQVLVVSLVTV